MLFHENDSQKSLLASIEHLREKWRGGSNRMSNLVLSHVICNQKRNALDAKAPMPRGAKKFAIRDAHEAGIGHVE